MIFSIYRITNRVNSKVYIGYTCQPSHRWVQHRFVARNPSDRDHMYIHRAIHKYGEDAFDFDVIYESKDSKHALLMETYFIGHYDSMACGYNLSMGGESGGRPAGFKLSDETKAKMSAAKIGKAKSEGMKAKLSAHKSQEWTVTHPDGVQEQVLNLRAFCIERGLEPGKMTLVAQGKRSHHKGYKVAKWQK